MFTAFCAIFAAIGVVVYAALVTAGRASRDEERLEREARRLSQWYTNRENHPHD